MTDEHKEYIKYYLEPLSEAYEEYSDFKKLANNSKQIQKQIDLLKKENLFVLIDCDSGEDIHFDKDINFCNDYWIINKKNITIINNRDDLRPHAHIFCIFSHDVCSSEDEHFAIIYYSKNDDENFTDDDDIEKKEIVINHKYVLDRNKNEDTEIHVNINNFDEKIDPWNALVIFESSLTSSCVEKIKLLVKL